MAKYEILDENYFAEGWKLGEIVDIDENSAEVAVEKGVLKLAKKTRAKKASAKKK